MITTYNTEKELGLDLSNNSIAYSIGLQPKLITEDNKSVAGYFDSIKNDQQDIYWYESILASVGTNLNDDVFTREDLWNARSTPVNKPVNYMHENDDRIGHMVASVAVDRDGNVIANETSIESLPQDFDIVTASVLYKVWDEPEKLVRAQEMIEDIEKGIWKVSMECRFNNFDYGLSSETQGDILVKRDESTAFLTQFLRIYGGVGEWRGYKISRVLRNFYFSAKGFVKNPANERSLILHNFANASIKNITDIEDIKPMTIEKDTSDSQALLSEIKTAHASELGRLTDRLEATEAKRADEVKALQDSLSEAKAAFEDMKKDKEKKDEEAKSTLEEATKAKEEAEAKVEELNKSVSALETEIAQLKSEKVTAERRMKLTKANVDEAKAEELLTVWAGATEEQFETIVAAYTKDETTDETDASASDVDFDEAEAESNITYTPPVKTAKSTELDGLLKSLAAHKDN